MKPLRFHFPWRSAGDIGNDIDAEIRFHLDTRIEELVAAGRSESEARHEARREFGDLTSARRDLLAMDRRAERTTRRSRLLTDFGQDIVYALRKLRSGPGFSLAALLTLALGIGANTAVFSVVNGVLLRPLPVPQPDRLYRVWSADRGADHLKGSVSPVDLDDWRAQRQQIADLGGVLYLEGSTGTDLTGSGDPQRLSVAFVTAGWFNTLGVRPAVGRLPREDELVRGGNLHVAVLSYGFWMRRFGGSPHVIDSTLTLDGVPTTVLGVMGADFAFPSSRVDAWLPYDLIPDSGIPRIRPVRVLDVVARARPGVTLAAVTAEMNTITHRLAGQYPADAHWDAATVMPFEESLTGDVRAGLLILLGAVGFVLLTACVNIASLLFARASAREREMAVRLALGASRWRLLRQLLVESLTLALAGAALGVLVALGGVRLLLSLGAGQLPRSTDIRLDPPVLLFALGLALLTGLLFGLAPAWRASGTSLAEPLRDGSRNSTQRGRGRLRGGLVVVELALAFVLAVGAALMTRSFVHLVETDPGFRPDHLIAVNFHISTDRHPTYSDYYEATIGAVRSLPGVISAGAMKDAPFQGEGELINVVPDGMTLGTGEQPPMIPLVHVSDGIFRTLGTPILAGREFAPTDGPDAPQVVVINKAFADRYFAGANPVGRFATLGGVGGPRAEVVGVVGNLRQSAMNEPARPTVYIDNLQNSRVKTTLIARTRGDPLALARAMQAAIWNLDKDQTITSVFTFGELVNTAVARPRLLTVLLALFGVMGVTLGALGVYGVLAYLVTQRRREIGVRLALGADRRSVLGMIVGRGLRLAVIGSAVGLVGALALVRLLRSVLYEVSPTDPVMFGAVALLLIAVAVAASWFPARRAAGVDPMETLRDE